jgi:hypothetical protein
MKTLVIPKTSKESAKEERHGNRMPLFVVNELRSHYISPLSTSQPLLQRQCACGGGCPHCLETASIQPKLKISEPSDQYEQEADRIADQVLASPGNFISSSSPPHIQRLTEQPTRHTAAVPDIVDRVLASPGKPLYPTLQKDMELRFGHDFSHVRVHTDAEAATSARAIQAKAYTVGKHVVFSDGAFAMGTAEGRYLVAHELAHVVQQGGTRGVVQRRMELETVLADIDDSDQEPIPMQDKPGSVPSAPPPQPKAPACLPTITGTFDVTTKPLLSGSGRCDLRLAKAPVAGGSNIGLDGMEFKGKVTITAPCPGKVYFVQYVNPKRSSVGCFDAKELGFCTTPGMGLDTVWPYPFGSVVNTDQNAGSIRDFNTVDSPGQRNISEPALEFVRVCIEDSFTTYMVFEDTAGNLTSLGYMLWNWNAHAERDGGSCPRKTTSNDCMGWTVTGTGVKGTTNFSVGAIASTQKLDRSVKAVNMLPSDCDATNCPKVIAPPTPKTPEK